MGGIPLEWKTSSIVLIPKPGKTVSLSKLRPISLTLYAGKLREGSVNLFNKHLKETNALPHTLLEYRENISIQDFLQQLKDEILDHPSTAQLRAVLALDVTKAFDNAFHDHIVNSLAETNCGTEIFHYVRNFLITRTVTISVGSQRSNPFPAQPGTPQGSILSPALFNLAMKNLPAPLSGITGVNHSIYADDLTLWAHTGSPAQIEDTLQAAVDATQAYAKKSDLCCAAAKSSYS